MLWKGFQRPKRLEFERETLTDRFGRFYAQPFERGFGTTVGNAMRRVLLSSIEGAAVTAVKIDGVLHEFSPIPGVVEDATDIILNLKQIPLKMHVDTTKTLYVRVDKPGEVRARDIEADADVEILEPDAHIATVADGGKLHMELRVKRGRGYVSADKNFDEDLGIGWIPVDSVHSPVKKVNYLVEAARIGQNTDYDKLTVDVWTNGSVTPRDAVSLSAKLIRDHLNIFINLEDAAEMQAEGGAEQPRAATQRKPRQERRGAGAFGSVVQLPQEREHPDDPRAGAEDRRRDAQDEELRPQVAERDQGDPRHAWGSASACASISRQRQRRNRASGAGRQASGFRVEHRMTIGKDQTMRHRVSHRKLGRVTEHRIALLRNQAEALIRHEHIETTVPKAKELRPFVERIITIAQARDRRGRGQRPRAARAAARAQGHPEPRRRRQAVRHDCAAVRDAAGRLHADPAPRLPPRRQRRGRADRAGRQRVQPERRSREEAGDRGARSPRASAAACARQPSACAASRRRKVKRPAEGEQPEEGQDRAPEAGPRRQGRHPRQGRQDDRPGKAGGS